MVVAPSKDLGQYATSYRIGVDGPAPVLTAEILSARTAQQRDLDEKMEVYALIGVPEYLIVDVTGQFLPERLLLKRLQSDRSWSDHQDADGGVTSEWGFRVIIDADGRPRVLNARTGQKYVRPDEAEQQIRELKQELNKLRAAAQRAEKKRN
jgi:hypothetical protein